MTYKPRVMLVTGGAGFIGTNFIHHVLKNEPNIFIVNYDKLTYAGSLAHLNFSSDMPYHFIQGDINDTVLVRHVLQRFKVNTIVNFAAESHVDRSIVDPSVFVTTNVNGTFNLLEAARHQWLEIENHEPTYCRFHHISTDEVYGSLTLEENAFTENSSYKPRSPYSASKAASDHCVLAYYHTYGLPITLSRSSNNYGPYQHAEKFIPTVINGCLKQQTISIYGSGKNIRDWLFVQDHCRGILSIIQEGKAGEDYNMGGGNEWENLILAEYICEIMDTLMPAGGPHKRLLTFIQDRAGHDFRYAINNQKINTELSWAPAENMESGLMRTIQRCMMKKAA